MEINSYSPSINIKRDIDTNHVYIPTDNAISVFNTISDNFKSGVHSFNLIGSYGTGKSAFLLAFYKHLNKQEQFFKPVNGQFNGCKKFHFIQIVGEYDSLVNSLAEELEVEADEKTVIRKIQRLQTQYRKKDECLVLVIDEFGKSLEYASKNNPASELYFIQRIAEYANAENRNFLFLTTLHQNFDAYAIGIDEKDRREWEKVKGRLKELPFNEPVEHLLNLAAQSIDFYYPERQIPNYPKNLLQQINKTNVFKLRNELSDDLVEKLFPLEPISAATLLMALQKYGQNERSLFGFLVSKESFGLVQHIEGSEKAYFGIDIVFDYLIFNFSYLIHSRNNPDFFRWRVILTALDRLENAFETNIKAYKRIVKTIGLLDLVHDNNAQISKGFIKLYLSKILGISKTDGLLKDLEGKSIIKYRAYRNSYSIYEGSDIDIEQEIRIRRAESDHVITFVDEVRRYLDLSYVQAKAASYRTGTTRIFQYQISSAPIVAIDYLPSEVDGIINIVISNENYNKDYKLQSLYPILYCQLDTDEFIYGKLNDLKIVDAILLEMELDKVARRELDEYKRILSQDINEYFDVYIFSAHAKWILDGKKQRIQDQRSLNKILSKACQKYYPSTPIFKNELINRTKLSGAIQSSKRSFISALINNWNKPYIGFIGDKIPPERTIYHTLLEDTGLHVNSFSEGCFNDTLEGSFLELWETSIDFLKSTKKGKRSVQELIDILSRPPFKMKNGFIEFWNLIFLFIHREDFAIYKDGAYVPYLSPEVAQLLFKKANTFNIKGIEVDGIRYSLFNKYRALISKEASDKITNRGFQEVARPFLVFYKQLSNYAKRTKKNLGAASLKLREALLSAKELEKTFFDDIPKCFGYTIDTLESNSKNIEVFAEELQKAIKELRLCDTQLSLRIAAAMSNHLDDDSLSIEELRTQVKNRYSLSIKHLLDPKQSSLHRRMHSPIDDDTLWISSLCQGLIGKALKDFEDEDEIRVYQAIQAQFKDLDSLVLLSEKNINTKKQVGFRYEIKSTLKEEPISEQFILPISQLNKQSPYQKKIERLTEALTKEQKQSLFLLLLKALNDKS